MYLATDIQTSEKICMELNFKGQEKNLTVFVKLFQFFLFFFSFS